MVENTWFSRQEGNRRFMGSRRLSAEKCVQEEKVIACIK